MVPLNMLDVGDHGQIVKIEKECCKNHEKNTSPADCECQDTESKVIEVEKQHQNCCKNGKNGKKVHMKHHSNSMKPNFHCRIEELGLRIGKNVSILQKGKRGPMLVKVDETRIALGQGMAAKILIKNS